MINKIKTKQIQHNGIGLDEIIDALMKMNNVRLKTPEEHVAEISEIKQLDWRDW